MDGLLKSHPRIPFVYHLDAHRSGWMFPTVSTIEKPSPLLFRRLSIPLFISPPSSRCCSLVRSGHPHGLHCRHRLWTDRPDLPHPAGDDSGDPSQRCGPVVAAVPLRLHHPDQEAALPARAGLGSPRVRTAPHVTRSCAFIAIKITEIDTDHFCRVKPNQSYVALLCAKKKTWVFVHLDCLHVPRLAFFKKWLTFHLSLIGLSSIQPPAARKSHHGLDFPRIKKD